MRTIELPYKELPGVISAAALHEHWKLYEGYVMRTNGAGQGDTNDLAGALLHELFFTGLTPTPSPVVLPVLRGALIDEWGTVDAFLRDLRRVAIESRGWAMLAYRPGFELRIFELQEHSDAVPGFEPLIVIDCYEHSYWMDWGTRKADYVDAVIDAIDWKVAEERWAKARR